MTIAPERFSPLRFSTYAKDLSQAVYDLSKQKMGATTDLRTSLGEDSLRVRFGSNKKFVTMGDTTVELDATASDEQVAHALNIQKINDIAGTTGEGTVPANPIQAIEKPAMSVTGIQSGTFQAALAKMREELAGHQNEAIADIKGSVTEAGAKMKEAAQSVRAKVYKEVEDALQEFATTTNGGPA